MATVERCVTRRRLQEKRPGAQKKKSVRILW